MAVPCLDRDHFDFEQFVKAKMNLPSDCILSAEWCFCGRGIPLLYEFLLNKQGRKLEKQLDGEEVFLSIDSDPIAKQTFHRFLFMLGAQLMGNSAALQPDDGLILCGNILISVLDKLKEDMLDASISHFYKGFMSNPPLNSYLETVPIYFTGETDLGIKGCLVGIYYFSITWKKLEINRNYTCRG